MHGFRKENNKNESTFALYNPDAKLYKLHNAINRSTGPETHENDRYY